MMWRNAVVISRGKEWSEAAEFLVQLDDATTLKALAYVKLVGKPDIGDRVIISASAVAKKLGTGGYAMIVAIPERLPADSLDSQGHIVKARYTPLQYMAMGVDEQDSPYHDVLEDADSIDGMPVLVADLHSTLVPALAGLRAKNADARIVYVMSDGAALPAWFSRSVAQLKEAGWIDASITAGQAFGGDYEAVNIHTALLAARHVLHADAVIVSQGPGNLGTGTRWGFSGTQVGDAINAVNTLDGRAVALLRMSEGDKRERHYGVSHHTTTALTRVALSPALCPVPAFDDNDELSCHVSSDLRERLDVQLDDLFSCERLTRLDVPTTDLTNVLRAVPFGMSTMGRSLDEDPLAFLAAGAAGYALAGLCTR